jgi:hypothetical protein
MPDTVPRERAGLGIPHRCGCVLPPLSDEGRARAYRQRCLRANTETERNITRTISGCQATIARLVKNRCLEDLDPLKSEIRYRVSLNSLVTPVISVEMGPERGSNWLANLPRARR